ncbi:MAG: hypothetical protein KW788_03175 [Candidatus Doudnabacteria bacterium]|nr:hypothetical protein [Candidatus Doudnabacteria bacterium]
MKKTSFVFAFLVVLFCQQTAFAQEPTRAANDRYVPPAYYVGERFERCMFAPATPYSGYPDSPERNSFCNQEERRYNNPPIRNPYGRGYGREYYSYPYGSYDGYYGNYPYSFDPCPSYLPEHSQKDKCVVSEIKFKILNRGLGDQVVVRINGRNAGMISKYSHPATSGLRLRADREYQITLEWVSKDGIKTVVDRIEPMTMGMQDGPYWYPISKALFDSAPYGEKITPERESRGGREYITGKEKPPKDR